MNIPNFCPTCNQPMEKELYDIGPHVKRIEAICKLHPIVYCSSPYNHNVCNIFYIDVSDRVRALWYPNDNNPSFLFNMVASSQDSVQDVSLQYFQPDLTNYDKLLDKLKTYLTFL